MIIAKTCKLLLSTLCTAGLGLTLAGCGGGEPDLNTDTATYEPEQRPLNVIAGDGGEYAPGERVTLSGRLVGTVDDETVLWSQTGGTAVEPDDWTDPALTFDAPMIEGIESLSFEIAALDGSGEVVHGDEGEPLVDSVEILVYDPEQLQTYTVDDDSLATLNGIELAGEGDGDYINGSLSERHTQDFTPGASVVFTLNLSADEAGFYTLYARFAIPTDYGGKEAGVSVNGIDTPVEVPATGSWDDYRVGTFALEEGENTIRIGGGWDYYRFDAISMIGAPAPSGPQAVTPTLVNADASEEAQELMAFLAGHYGSATLSGQTEFLQKNGEGEFALTEFDKVTDATGGEHAPAIVAFDFMDFSASRVANGTDPHGMSEFMIEQHREKNILLSPLWHWNAPSGLHDTEEQPWYRGFYTEATDFDLATALADPNSTEYAELMDDIDTIADELRKFADADIPVLWRPLHEAEGEWFWWGAAGSEAFVELWEILYERLTHEHQLNNLIWVYTYAGALDEDWYPGDHLVDIVGYDGYDGNNADNPFAAQFETLLERHDGEKLIAMPETGTMPNVELMHDNNAWWAFYIVWNSSEGSDYGPDGQDPAVIAANYAQEGVINLADLPRPASAVDIGLYEGFEGADAEQRMNDGGWGFQINWGDTDGLHISADWAAEGDQSLAATTLLEEGDEAILQAYPEGGLVLGDATRLSLVVNVANAGDDVQVSIWAKDPDYADLPDSWAASEAVSSGPVTLELDVSDVEVLSGFGVRFQGMDNTDSDATFYLDQVEFLD